MKYGLTEKEEQAVIRIVEEANRTDGTTYTAPVDADAYYLSCHGGEPVSFLAVYGMGDTRNGNRVEEVLLFTRPEFRNHGRAAKLWRKYCEDSAGQQFSVRFSVYECVSAGRFLKRVQALHDHDEVLMARHLGGSPEPGELETADFPVRNEYSECSVRTCGNVGYVYGVRTDAGHLREGSAQRLLEEVFTKLYGMGASDAVLEVSSANVPAWKLYRKMGFEVEEKLQIWYIDFLR